MYQIYVCAFHRRKKIQNMYMIKILIKTYITYNYIIHCVCVLYMIAVYMDVHIFS